MSTLHGTWTLGAVAGGAAVSWTPHAGVDVRALTAAGVHATRVLGASAATGSLVCTAFFAAMTLARSAGDALRARLGAAAALTAGGCVASCGYLLVLVSGMLPGAVSAKVACALTGWVLAGTGMALVWPVVLSTLGTAGRSAAFLSTVTTISYSGGLAGPALIGILAQALSLPVALTVPAALAVVVALAAPRLLAAAVPPGRPRPSPS